MSKPLDLIAQALPERERRGRLQRWVYEIREVARADGGSEPEIGVVVNSLDAAWRALQALSLDARAREARFEALSAHNQAGKLLDSIVQAGKLLDSIVQEMR